MKTISFEKKSFESSDILTRLQMKNVKGGHAGTCQGLYANPWPGGDNIRLTNLSAEDAQSADLHWCCDSCCQATWADHSGC